MSAIRSHKLDLLAIAVLILLWLLFFWRLFTPIAADQASLKQGDFSGQFVAFAGYQYQRFAAGEVPLWNPYNNGGLPFIADTQAAVFYPPRLLTIALSSLSGGWTYHALELEMTFHVLAYTLMLYAFARRLTGSVLGALIAAVIGGYGGYLSGYPPLQLALLEAGVWLPLAALGVLEATHSERLRWTWLVVTGFALGMSWLAGHPQTSFFLTYLLVAYYGYRAWGMPHVARAHSRAPLRENRVILFILGVALFGAISFGLAAVQLLPGFEYLSHTTRAGFGFDAKSNGFPLQDVAQFFLPGVVSLYSPLWVGIAGLALALIALWRRLAGAWFWGAVALVALLLSFGGNSPVFAALYNALPGLRYFRGQERAAYLVANSLAILAAMGAAWLAQWDSMHEHVAGLRLALNRAFYLALALGALVFVVWVGSPGTYAALIRAVVLAILVTGAMYLIISIAMARSRPQILWAIVPLVIFELFSINMDSAAVYDHVPPGDQLSMSAPPLVAQALADSDTPFRVDGFRGLTDNYGSLYDVMDIHGISPLWMDGPYNLIEGDVPDERSWELFAVRYVFTDWQKLPVPAEIVGTGADRYGAVNLHRLDDPRPFALLAYSYTVAPDDEAAYALLRDPAFDARRVVILARDPGVPMTTDAPQAAEVLSFAPEALTIHADATRPAILSVALPDYPGWYATIDGAETDILRAYGGLTALVVPEGDHSVRLVYNPLSYRVGASLSLFTWIGLFVLGVVLAARRIQSKGAKDERRKDKILSFALRSSVSCR